MTPPHHGPLAPPLAPPRPVASATSRQHLRALERAVRGLEGDAVRLERWGRVLRHRLEGGARLLAAGNGGSAALASHLVAELVGRYRGERPPFSAISLAAEAATTTALGNDYGYEEVFARQVAAHGRPGDVVLLLTTSGRSPNLVRAAQAAVRCGCTCWAMSGPAPNPLTRHLDDQWAVDAPAPVVQEIQQVGVHLVCAAFDEARG